MHNVFSDIAKYSDSLQKFGYTKQAKAVGILISRLMLQDETVSNKVIRAKDTRVGMILAGVGKHTGFGAPGSYGEVKYIHTKDSSFVVGVYAPQVEDNFEIVLHPEEKVVTLSVTKPMQRKALRLKAKTLLASLAVELESHDLGPQLARLNYELVI